MQYNLSVIVGNYEKDGEKKARFADFGVIRESNQGKVYLKLDDVVTNYLKGIFGQHFEGFVIMSQPKTRSEASQAQGSVEDTLPF